LAVDEKTAQVLVFVRDMEVVFTCTEELDGMQSIKI